MSAALALAGLAALAPSSQASYHEMRIRAVFKGPVDVSFVQLQMTAAGQDATAGKVLTFYDHLGVLTHTSMPLPDVLNGANQSTILIGDTMAAGSPDLTYGTLYQNLNEDATGGALCYENVDCFSWGGFTGQAMLPSPDSTPASGLSNSQVLIRSIAANCPTLLENADDTNSSLADFGFGFFPPRNNSVPPSETPCPPALTPIATPVIAPIATPVKKCKKGRKLKKGKCVKKKRKKK